MSKKDRSGFKDHPFHLVDPSPWPLFTCASLLGLTSNASLSMHNFSNSHYLVYLSLLVLVASMSFWFRDIITEGTSTICINVSAFIFFCVKMFPICLDLFIVISELQCYMYNLTTARAISKEDVTQALNIYKSNSNYLGYNAGRDNYENNPENFGYYLAGLLEGDGHISIPALFKNSKSTRVFNPRIVFTSHINNLGLYSFIQCELGNIGRFQCTGTNILRYIIGDIKGIQYLINLMHGKLRTPKNQTFNNLIKIMNDKYSLSIAESLLDTSDFKDNSWLTGFTESDGHFGIKYVESKAKSELMIRARSEHVTLKCNLTNIYYNIFVSLVLSGGWISIHHKTNLLARIKLRQSFKNNFFIYYIFMQISSYCSKLPYRFISIIKGKRVDELIITTKWLNIFTELHSLFYKNNVKKLPHNIYDLITPLVLFNWVSVAGEISKLGERGLIINTEDFNIPDVVKLINILIIKYSIHCRLHLWKNKNTIYIYRSSLKNLIKAIDTVMIPEKRSQFSIWKTLDSNLSRKNKTVSFSLRSLDKNLLNININVRTKRNYSFTSYNSNFIFCNNLLNKAYSTFTNSTVVIKNVKYYEDAYMEKSLIFKENNEKAGIYRWVNKVNGKSYIGSSINLKRRFRDYYSLTTLEGLLVNKKKNRSLIYRSLIKYGHSNFSLEILEYCEKDQVIIREQYYMDLLNPDYNILKFAGSSFGYKHSPETIDKFKAREFSPETRAKISQKTQTAERIEQLKRLHADPDYQQKRLEQLKLLNSSPEQKELLLKNAMLTALKVEVLDTFTNIKTVYDSISEAARSLEISQSSISKAFKYHSGESTIWVKKKRYQITKITNNP